jgi:tetratricopeptide (TPR) repeat protein
MKKTVLLIIALLLFISFSPARAELKTFIKEYTYHAGDEDSKNSSRTIALREVKRLLLEELGTYLESQTEIKNFQMTKDQITTLTAGIVSTEVIEDAWDGKKYWLKAKIAANPQDVIESVDNLRKDRQKVKELEKLRKKSEELLWENVRLNKELKVTKGGKKQAAAQAYKRNIDNLNATEWLERGHKLGISGNYADAIKAYSKVIELNPRDLTAYVNRGTAYAFLGNYQQAIQDYNKAIELNPQDTATTNAPYFNRGTAYTFLGNYQQAIKDYSKAIELEPREAMAYLSRGSCYVNLGNYQQAIKDYDKAIELEPQNTRLYHYRGACFGKLGNYQQAIADYNKAIQLNPQLAESYSGRGFCYAKLGSYQLAIRDYNKAIEFDPLDAMTYYNRGSAFGKLSNYQQMVEDIKVAARLGDKIAQDFLRSQGIEL